MVNKFGTLKQAMHDFFHDVNLIEFYEALEMLL